MIVKLQGTGYLLNESKSVPNDPNNTDYQAIQRWLIGHTDEYLAELDAYNKAVSEHDNWLKIQSYESDYSAYLTALEDWQALPIEESLGTEQPTQPIKPQGYYTQDEVDASQVKWDEWNTAKLEFVPDEFTTEYPVPEPTVLQRPSDIPEPTIPVEPVPVPNTPLPEFTDAELAEQEATQYQRDRLAEYPSWGEQLDMVWHSINDGLFGDAVKSSKFYQTIKEVKDKYAKPL